MSAAGGISFVRHTLATVAYRTAKTLRGAPPDFASFRPAPGARSAGQILAHMGDLCDWALSIARGKQAWKDSEPQPWEQECERFFSALTALDRHLAAHPDADFPWERLLQGPIADALTHTGQLALLRRLAEAPVKGENYFRARIEAGNTGPEQLPPEREF